MSDILNTCISQRLKQTDKIFNPPPRATSAMMSTSVVNPENIHDLREQIFANAAVLFPRIVRNHPSFDEDHIIRPGEVFDVIVTRPPGLNSMWKGRWQAILVYGADPYTRKVAAKGHRATDAGKALDGLLATLSDALGHGFIERKMVEPTQFGSRYAVVDLGLVD